MTTPVHTVEMNGISKSFFGVSVLKEVSFSVLPGEIHALAGENGAGKSTLMKILQGVYAMDAGSIRLKGEEVSIKEIIEMIIKISKKDISIIWDITKPNGDLKRLMDTTKQKQYNLETEAKLNQTIKIVYDYYCNSINK